MIPLLAPLLGSLAGSLLPASVGTGIAGALGLKGATAGLVASAAPKAIGAGIGTLLAGGDLGDAALNAVGFGAGSALTSQLMGAGAVNAGAGAAAAGPQTGMLAAAPPASPAVPADAAAAAVSPQDMMRVAGQLSQAMGGGQQTQPAMAASSAGQPQPRSRASENPMLTAMAGPAPSADMSMAGPAAVPSDGGSSMMPAAVGIGSLPMQGQQPMSNDMMLAGMSPNQSNMVNQYLSSRNMVGFV